VEKLPNQSLGLEFGLCACPFAPSAALFFLTDILSYSKIYTREVPLRCRKS
jgi:hypothetical protein